MDGEDEAKGVNQVKPRIITLCVLSEKLATEISQIILHIIML